LVSGAPDLNTALRAVEYGAFEYLTKPVETDKFRASVSRAIEGRRKKVETQRELVQYRSGSRIRSAHVNLRPGERWTGMLLGGHYRVGELIGEGGMGSVYEASREDLAGMRVAIKVLHPELSGRADLVARFRREAETVAAINHPNIVKILDFQALEGEPVFFVMERLEGASLADCLAAEGKFDPLRAVFITSQVLAALSVAHREGVIHRDLKPDNVFLTSLAGVSDVVKLLDFGVAKLLGEQSQKLTQTGVVLGTPSYMAPEHARGSEVDARSDVYAVGCILYELLSGRPPFIADNYNALLCAVLQGVPPPISELRPDLEPELAKVIQKAMARNVVSRYQSAEGMSRALSHWQGSGTPSRPPISSRIAFAPTLVKSGDSRKS
jgi:serine/threonine-protein kinase